MSTASRSNTVPPSGSAAEAITKDCENPQTQCGNGTGDRTPKHGIGLAVVGSCSPIDAQPGERNLQPSDCRDRRTRAIFNPSRSGTCQTPIDRSAIDEAASSRSAGSYGSWLDRIHRTQNDELWHPVDLTGLTVLPSVSTRCPRAAVGEFPSSPIGDR
jgi:hypothetical protein